MDGKILSMDVAVLAGQYQLGAPLRVHRRANSLVSMVAGIGAGLAVLIFASAISYATLNPSYPPTAFLARPLEPGLFIGLSIAYLVGAVTLLAGVKAFMYLRFRAWECEEGFLEFDNTGALRAALRWDQIQKVWHKVKVSGNPRTGARYEHTYSVQGLDGREVTLNYPHLWKRIESEFVRTHLAQTLATINHGDAVSFHGLLVSAQGISNQPALLHSFGSFVLPGSTQQWFLPWQSLACMRVKQATIGLEPAGAPQHVRPLLMLSHVSDLCLLKELVQAISGGHVIWVEQK